MIMSILVSCKYAKRQSHIQLILSILLLTINHAENTFYLYKQKKKDVNNKILHRPTYSGMKNEPNQAPRLFLFSIHVFSLVFYE